MMKLAHIADCHIGAWRDDKLRELNLQAFEQAIDKCIQERVNCILISGDLFDSGMPEFTQTIRVIVKLKQAEKSGIRMYVIYGSHDYSPNATSLIDLLHGAELFTKVSEGEFVDDRLQMRVFEDKPTGVKVVGISGRRLGLERKNFESLDRDRLEKIANPKVFLFHTTVAEFNPGLPIVNAVPASLFPRGFAYYAGGHIHKSICEIVDDYGLFAYPGPPFGADFTDLENTAKGDKRGFYVVEIDGPQAKPYFIELDIPRVEYYEVDADGKTPTQVQDKLDQLVAEVDGRNKIVLVRIRGQLSAGKTGDVNTVTVKESLLGKGAHYVYVNKNALTTAERLEIGIRGATKEEIEREIFSQTFAQFRVEPTLDTDAKKNLEEKLVTKGTQLAHSLLTSLRTEKKEGEMESDFDTRILKAARRLLDLDESE